MARRRPGDTVTIPGRAREHEVGLSLGAPTAADSPRWRSPVPGHHTDNAAFRVSRAAVDD
jgi:hypothetical protein